jgi:hypothetical protein
MALDPATFRADEGASSTKISRPVGIEIEMPVDFAAPVTHAATPQNALFGAPPIVFIVGLSATWILASPSRGMWACACASSESSIDMMEAPPLLAQRSTRYGQA